MHTPFTMNTQKSLQMVLTTLLLVLAILAMNWQERMSRQNAAASHGQHTKALSTEANLYADCCLYHALQAAEGGEVYTGGNHAEKNRLVLHTDEMLLRLDSTKHLAARSSYH